MMLPVIKLQKRTIDNTVSLTVPKITTYIGGAVYLNDTLQFFGTPEGRVMSNADGTGWVYDYFLKDHLGNTRMMITDDYNVSSPILEATSYYPFGLQQKGIGLIQEINPLHNKYLYNKGSELQEDFGLDYYDTDLRQLDPQLGRWWQNDPKPDMSQSLYSAMNNNPMLYNDPLGDTILQTFRTGFLGIFGKKVTVVYDAKNQRWNNTDGSAYTGKTTGFSRMTLSDLKTNQKNELGNTIVTNLATDNKNHYIKNGDPNSNRTDDPNIYYNGSSSSPDKILQGGQSMNSQNSPSYVILGHEMTHKFDQNLGIRNVYWFGASGDQRGVDEYNAMYYENILRQANGLPPRTAYQETNGVTQGVILNAAGNLQPMPIGLSSQNVNLPAYRSVNHKIQLFLRIF